MVLRYGYILLGCFFLVSFARAQTVIEDKQTSFKSFTKNDGLEVGFIETLQFDNEGWLWLLGFESELGLSSFLENKLILQRFDGFSFKSIDLPVVAGAEMRSALMFKRNDGLFYLKLSTTSNELLYLFDPYTFIFQKVNLPKDWGEIIINGFFSEGETTYLTVEQQPKSFLYELDRDLNFKKMFELNSEPRGGSVYLNMLIFPDHYLVTDQHTGTTLYSLSGKQLKVFDWTDLPSNRENAEGRPVFVTPRLIDGAYHFRVEKEPFLLIYDPQKQSWKRSAIVSDRANTAVDYNFDIRYESISDDSGNIIYFDTNQDQFIIKRLLSGRSEIVRKSFIDIPAITSASSRDIGKEVFIASPGNLHRITFKQLNVLTFLDDLSIRSLAHWQGSEYIVGAESAGFFIIDIEEQTTRKLFRANDAHGVIASEIRGIFKDGDVIWSNYNGGVIRINTKTSEVTRYRHFPIWSMVENGNEIYYGSNEYPLMVFNKTTGENTPLSRAGSLTTLDIEIFEGRIFMTTEQGLFTYENGIERFHKIDVALGQLMMLDLNEERGLLISTRQGEVFAMKHKDDQPELIYQDPRKIPIASILTDNEKNLWLNTFQGILKIESATGKMVRYLREDGLSHNEMNRYSQLVTQNGGFLVGSVRGLNYFHPETIKKVEKTGNISLTGLTLYDAGLRENKELVSPEMLSAIDYIPLPAENRYLKVNVAPSGIIENPGIQMQYRLNEGEWQNLKDYGTIELLNIAPGRYQLESRLVDSEGSAFGETFSIEITANQFFYKTIWFITLCFLLIVSVSVYLILQARRAGFLQQRFTQSLIQAQEDERRRISRDLHDGVGQQLILLKNQAKSGNDTDILNTATDTLEEVRSITRDLHPVVLNQLGLTAALEDMVSKLDKSSDVFFSMELDNIDGILDASYELNIYRIVQEVLNNLVKHAEAMSAMVKVEKAKQKICITIRDNGKGFLIEEKKIQSQSLGLKTLYERAAMMNARLKLSSGEVGTEVSLHINLP